jgi:MoaA/NifB/PqqE/SkfB family radical SAM enzyme
MATATPFGRRLLPAVCDVSVTNVCNATCNFCCFAYDKGIVKDRLWIDAEGFARALPILYRRGIRYLNFQGGEPLLHPAIERLVFEVRTAGMRPTLITNGWLLQKKIEGLLDAGLGTLLVSIDSHSIAAHERNRGLRGVGERIRAGLAAARDRGVPTVACVTVNRLVDYDRLPDLLTDLGFDAATFSYPRREPLGSSSLVYSPDSALVDLNDEERIRAFEAIKRLKQRFLVGNPVASLAEMQRHVNGQEEIFPCVGGYKYFYLDWNLVIWRCEAWSKPLGSVFDLDRIPDQRDPCTACTMNCYRDTSVLMHAGVAMGDAAAALARGGVREAVSLLFRRSVVQSLGAVVAEAGYLRRLAPRRSPAPPIARPVVPDRPEDTGPDVAPVAEESGPIVLDSDVDK